MILQYVDLEAKNKEREERKGSGYEMYCQLLDPDR
jgi:hypothetical protein